MTTKKYTLLENDSVIQETTDIENLSDGFHTFNELYDFRLLYNACFFNTIANKAECHVHKSKRHHDGELCFDGKFFIVTAYLNGKQISNHYEIKHWDLFKCEEQEVADVWDGHTPNDVKLRMQEYITQM